MNEEVEIVLTDGFKVKAKVNGNTYYTESAVDEKELTDANLVSVKIGDSVYENLTCTIHDNEKIGFRQYTLAEMAQKKLEAQIQYVAMMNGVTL